MFLLPQGEEGPQGEKDQEPIALPGVTKPEMEILLDYFYEGYVGRERTICPSLITEFQAKIRTIPPQSRDKKRD